MSEFTGSTEDVIKSLEKYKEPTSTAESTPYLKILLYGDGGVGKTILASRFGKTLIFSTDSGWTSTKNNLPFTIDTDKMDWVEPAQLQAVAKAVRHKIPPYDVYDTFVLDTISGATENYLDYLLDMMDLDKRNVARFKDMKLSTKIRPLEASGFDDYGHAKIYMRGILRNLMAAECNVFLVAHDREPDFMGQRKKILPDLPDKVYKAALYNTQLTGLMTRNGNERKIDFTTSTQFSAKSRIQELDGQKVTDEQFIRFVEKWQGRSYS